MNAGPYYQTTFICKVDETWNDWKQNRSVAERMFYEEQTKNSFNVQIWSYSSIYNSLR